MRYTDTKQCKQCGETFNRKDSYTNRNDWNKVMFCSCRCRMACHYYITFKKRIPKGVVWGHNLSKAGGVS